MRTPAWPALNGKPSELRLKRVFNPAPADCFIGLSVLTLLDALVRI